MKATVTSKGQVTIPHAIRAMANINPGSELDFQITKDGTLVAHVVTKEISELKGFVKNKLKKPVSLRTMKKAISEHWKK